MISCQDHWYEYIHSLSVTKFVCAPSDSVLSTRIAASSAIDSGDGYDIFIEYMSHASVSDGRVTSIDENTTEVIAFGY